MDAEQTPTLTLDARGTRCPVPVIELARHLSDIAIGEVIAVLASDAAARLDVPAWCRMQSQDYLGSRPVEGGAAYLVRRVT